MKKIKTSDIKEGVRAGTPILIGYMPIAIAFGVLARNTGLSLKETFLFSALVFAGASQFVAINLISLGTGTIEIIATTLLVNMRHFLMSASLASSIRQRLNKWKFPVAFGITDEVFSVASLSDRPLTAKYMVALEAVAYSSWVGGSVIGFVAGAILPLQLKNSLNIALYAMFAALLVPEMKKSFQVMVIAVLSGLLNIIFLYVLNMPQGWSIVLSIIIASFSGLYIFEGEKSEDYDG